MRLQHRLATWARHSRLREPRLMLESGRLRRSVTGPAPEPGRIWLAMAAPEAEPATIHQALDHWRGQGVDHALVAGTAAARAALAEAATGIQIGWLESQEGTDARVLWQAMADQANRWSGSWVIPCRPEERWFAQNASVADFLTRLEADQAQALVYDVARHGQLWHLDKTRQSQPIVAFRPTTRVTVGPGAAWIRGDLSAPDHGLGVLRLGEQPPRGRTVPVTWPDWTSWDPHGQIGQDVVAGANQPGAHPGPRANASNAVRGTVITAPEWMGFGNMLYLLMSAHARGAKVVLTPALRPWLATFPELTGLTIEPDAVRPWHRRENPLHRTYGAFGLDFSREQLTDFVSDRLLTNSALADRPPVERLVVNIRRGDYYRVAEFQEAYGFDQLPYLRQAVARLEPDIGPILVVSDDIGWCRSRLGWLADHGPVEYADPTDSPARNFADVAVSDRLIITNSTFSYWAAHVGNVLHDRAGRPNQGSVVAPWFFSRAEAFGRAYQLDPHWQIVTEIPGGWNGSIGEPG